MAYNPGIQNRSGELIAAGLTQGISALAGAIIDRAGRRRQKEELAEAVKVLQPMVEKLAPGAGVNLSKDVPKEAIPQVIQLAGELGRVQREAPLRQLQIENEQLRHRISQQEIDQAAANAEASTAAAPFLDPSRVELPNPEAVRTAFNSGERMPAVRKGPDYTAAVSAYLAKRGTDPRMLAQLGDLAQQQMRSGARGEPGLRNFGTDASGRPVEGLVDAQGNVRYIEPPKSAKEVAQPFQIGDKTFYRVGSTILDATGVPVKAPTAKPLDPFAAQALYGRYKDVLEQAASTDVGMFESKAAAEKRTAQLREQANFLAAQLGFEAPFPSAGVAPQRAATNEKPEASTTTQSTGNKPTLPYTAAEVQAELKRRRLVK